MKLLLRRDQKKSIMGKMIFTLDARAELLPEEKDAVQKYKMAGTMLYEKFHMIDRGRGILGFLSRLVFRFVNVAISVENLVKDKHIECKGIVEMRSVE